VITSHQILASKAHPEDGGKGITKETKKHQISDEILMPVTREKNKKLGDGLAQKKLSS